MKNIRLKVTAAVLASVLLFGTSVPVMADPLTTEQSQQLDSAQAEYEAIEAKIHDLHEKLDVILDDITDIMVKIDDTNAQIAGVEAKVAAKEAEIAAIQAELDIKTKEYGDRLRAMYMQGNTGLIDAILGSESLADLIARADAIIKIAKIDKQMLDEINALKADLEVQKEALQAEIATLNDLNLQNEADLAAVKIKQDETNVVLAEMEREEKKLRGSLEQQEAGLIGDYASVINSSSSSDSELNAAITALRAVRSQIITEKVDNQVVELIEKAKRILREREAARQAAASAGSSASRGEVSASSSAIVNYAYNFLGIRYVWGGNTPSTGFDCSGFTKYVYAHFGVNLPRVSREQAKVGTYKSVAERQPGDLLYFGSGGRVTHVGIYIGNNQMIHAPRPGKSVEITTLRYYNNYMGARRIIGN
ncbi:C40 family peptidase [Youngiibacter fragilis]|uniref:Glycoside hydrolase n=1 Tax=Youngiibacter fragilis 232.1 TaxID=994573 RepID=V7I238_9CLOT|nr:C40 family peptidase [Youngiibacter fragilis]ETA79239.1 glycoside hydrolase [Youngiibacter fragilis 232.1]